AAPRRDDLQEFQGHASWGGPRVLDGRKGRCRGLAWGVAVRECYGRRGLGECAPGPRHCERSEAIHLAAAIRWIATSLALLAMTRWRLWRIAGGDSPPRRLCERSEAIQRTGGGSLSAMVRVAATHTGSMSGFWIATSLALLAMTDTRWRLWRMARDLAVIASGAKQSSARAPAHCPRWFALQRRAREACRDSGLPRHLRSSQ
ncbi:MAG: hypothetical protein JWO64_2814, partial [Hyphomicrobiales bacterium]|nr:hypothetical protein [Hyphomicrobiales bacterium]